MSRSYKKHPFNTDDSMAKDGKKFAKKRVRNTDLEDVPLNGSGYKKYYPQYDIRDWKFYWTWEDAVAYYRGHPEQYSKYPTEEEFRNHWEKLMRRK